LLRCSIFESSASTAIPSPSFSPDRVGGRNGGAARGSAAPRPQFLAERPALDVQVTADRIEPPAQCCPAAIAPIV
jgi:hypothetical protein